SGGSVTATFGASLQSLNHIVFIVQENRGLDHYFGALQQYRTQKGIPGTFDGLPQFNSPAGIVAINPGCDPAFPFQASPAPFNDCVTVVNGAIDPNSPQVPSQKLITQCVENPSPSWNESHVDWNVVDPLSATATMDGFVHTAAHDVRETQYIPGSNPPESDYDGVRAMGYYDQDVLPYYYFMASNFATSDRWFSPVMTRTQPNREYLMAATSLGHVYPPASGAPQFTNKTIFEQLSDNNISWRIYVSDSGGSLQSHTELGMYTFANSQGANFVPASQFLTDIQNGTLPAVAEIDPGFESGTDEHAEQDDSHPGKTGPTCDFVYTGYRVPLIVISPFSKKNYVSHTVADYTAILKFIETRFNVPSLTQRDAAQMDMTEFLDFVNAPWKIPPTPSSIPTQPTSAPCYMDHLP